MRTLVYGILTVLGVVALVLAIYWRAVVELLRLAGHALADDAGEADAIIDAADRATLDRAMRGLPLDVGALLWLHVIDGQSIEHCAEVHAVSAERMAQKLAELKAILAERIRREQALRASDPASGTEHPAPSRSEGASS